ncbi:hypothetical protein BDR07DRAFT_1427544 [Suillus spraguei]|nr:hypothetical protein BDR07DRAFT_1427544 [Suillus spraguei]
MLGTLEQVKSHHEAKEAKFEVEIEQVRQAKDTEMEQQKAEIERVRQSKVGYSQQTWSSFDAEIEQLRARLAALEG